MIELPNLTIDRDGDGPDVQVVLTQDFGGNAHMVSLHPCQVQLLAERMGILAPDAEAQRTIARLSRQLRLLLERIDQLDDWLNQAAQRGHEDLSMETTYSMATWELAREFCADLPAEPKVIQAAAAKPTTTPTVKQPQSAAPDRTNAARQKRHRERQKQQRNGASVTPVTDSAHNAAPTLFETAGACQ